MMVNTGQDSDYNKAEDSGPTPTSQGHIRLLWISGIGAVTAAVVGLLVVVVPRQQPAQAAALDPMPITAPAAGAPPIALDVLARTALTDTTSTGGTVDHLIIDSWSLNSVIDGQDVTSAMFPSRRELWRTSDNQARSIDTTPGCDGLVRPNHRSFGSRWP